MNKINLDLLKLMKQNDIHNQRELADLSGYSLGLVNREIKKLRELQLVDEDFRITSKAKTLFKKNKPKNAVILAAGFGMRMVPINTETPKGLLEVKNEPLIERLIKQLQKVGVKDITVVVGFMKEQYEYLIDEYQVKLAVNTDYASKNNFYSLQRVSQLLGNTYIVPCDLWCKENPFAEDELYSWYLIGHEEVEQSFFRVNKKQEIIISEKRRKGNRPYGICYLAEKEAKVVAKQLDIAAEEERHEKSFWEVTLEDKDRKYIVYPKMIDDRKITEINTYEQLREIDRSSSHLETDALVNISKALEVPLEEIINIEVLKKGMTNRSFLFTCKEQKYIMRIPGEGTDYLINRKEEADVYHVLEGKKICDDVVYMNPENGYKITIYLEGARSCDSENKEDLKRCMAKLREFHNSKLKVSHTFDPFKQIVFYQSLWNGQASYYKDHEKTQKEILSLKSFVEKYKEEPVLSHIDSVYDNFLFTKEGDIRLIDWEYAGMQDPHIDIAMFCIYAGYTRKQADELMDLYFEGKCKHITRLKIYAYIAISGMLWSNWCEYKRTLGVDFGEYSLMQYRYAKDFYRIVQEELAKEEK
ncbi:MAG: phosphotransferase [Carnobacterium sp.]|nr:phosphotransferase [Carnobacterium sp.]